MANTLSLSLLLQLVIILSSFSCACVPAGFHVHSLLFPIFQDSVPHLESTLRSWFTPPFLFILLNVLVAALYVTSRMMPQGRRGQQDAVDIHTKLHEASNLDVDCSNKMLSVGDTMTAGGPPEKMFGHVLSTGSGTVDKRFETQTKSTSNRHRRLVRSKSDGSVALATVGRTPTELRAIVPLLKKSGTFEPVRLRRRVKPVVVADLPEEGQVAEEEVDKKAEEFIGRFYQRVKLQR